MGFFTFLGISHLVKVAAREYRNTIPVIDARRSVIDAKKKEEDMKKAEEQQHPVVHFTRSRKTVGKDEKGNQIEEEYKETNM